MTTTRNTTRPHSSIEPMWTTAQLAEYLNVPPRTIAKWRLTDKAPPGYRYGKHLRYDPGAVRKWLITKGA